MVAVTAHHPMLMQYSSKEEPDSEGMLVINLVQMRTLV
jgi:hypothetical protein